jgi:hypothetical protein
MQFGRLFWRRLWLKEKGYFASYDDDAGDDV